jgi:hypothetical protein
MSWKIAHRSFYYRDPQERLSRGNALPLTYALWTR